VCIACADKPTDDWFINHAQVISLYAHHNVELEVEMIEETPGYDFKKDLVPDQLRQTFKLERCLDEE